jgi:metallo-beta-lactamase class B
MNDKGDNKISLPSQIDDLTPVEPVNLFDNLCFVGTKSVGAFVIDTGDGLIMIDSGWGDKDCARFVDDMRQLGFDPLTIKIILISHEHLDHYGGIPYLKKNVCPDAKVALSATGWYYLQERVKDAKLGTLYRGAPESIDILLKDGQEITLGNTTIRIVYTPGHAPGCVSFIFPVTDNGETHMVGIMGGGGVSPDWERAYLYKSSIEYFQKFTREAKCDVGLVVHFWDYDSELAALRSRKPGDANPFVIGSDMFESEYLQIFRDRFQDAIKKLPPEKIPPPPSGVL